jgi:drug/metabolite transporter (DMT)-like permease
MVGLSTFFFFSPGWLGWGGKQLADFREAITHPSWTAILSGVPYGIVAFFSVFIFMFKGRTATFAGLVNRLTSLLAGTAATLLLFVFFKTEFPSVKDWLSVAFILIAVYFLTRAEKRRVAELGLAAEPRPAGAAIPAPATVSHSS